MTNPTRLLFQSDEKHRLELAERNRWMIQFRWFYIILLPTIATAATLLLGRDKAYIKLYLLLAVVGLGLNGILWLIARPNNASSGYYRALALAQVVIDLCLASVVIYSQGGISSRATVLYAVPVIGAGSLFRYPAAYIAAILSGLAYAGSVIVPALKHPDQINIGDIWVPAIFYPTMFILLAALITRFSAINSRDEQEKAYQELLSQLHDRMQQPTNAIANTIEKLEASPAYPGWTIQDKELLSEIVGENARLNAMITNILASADETRTTKDDEAKSADLGVLLRDSAMNCALAAGRKSDLLLAVPDKRVPIYGQPQQLRTAFDNIIDNAFRYSTRKSYVTVSLEYDEDTGHITVQVKDKGRGISQDDQKQLFQLFARLEEQAVAAGPQTEDAPSLGLGLYVSKVILERHHGKLELDSEPNKGTTVTIRIQEELWRRKS